MLRKVPLIVILGSTGTGKTKLSLELAERFGGEIISADSMQVYANLDIATAKATREEQSRAKHHLLDVATPSAPFTVVHFRNAALPIIENLLAHSRCPIVVGGTNYYIESLLWDILVSPTQTDQLSTEDAAASVTDATGKRTFLTADDMAALSSDQLHEHLRAIDLASANRIHPNNKRKIQRAIEVFQQTGTTLTAKLEAQRQQPGGNRLGGPLRFPHTILFWLRCNQDVLNGRLDKRVDAMLKQGLLREIRAFHNDHMSDKSPTGHSYTKGVLQTIGFKEFIPYLEQFNAANDLKIEEYLRANAYKMPTEEHFKINNENTKHSTCDGGAVAAAVADASSIDDPNNTTTMALPPGLELLNNCLNELKLVTRRYSKKQIKWINNRFLASKDRQVPELYELDTSDVGAWRERVYRPAETIIDCYRSGQVCEIPPMPKRLHPGAGLNEETNNYCTTCERHFIGEFQWQLHLKSNKHKKRKESRRKLERVQLDAAALATERQQLKTQDSASDAAESHPSSV